MGENDGNNFCHYRSKRCTAKYSSCSVSDQELGCMITNNLLTVIEGIVQASTDDCTDADGNRCKKIFDSLEVTAKTGCNIALDQICDLEKCPENFYSSVCKAQEQSPGHQVVHSEFQP